MIKGNLLLVPSGGLANRMRSIVSGHVLAKNIGSGLQVIWFKDWGLNAMFGEIFEPLELIPLREATFIDKLLYDRARKKNFYITALPQKILFDKVMEEQDVKPLKLSGFSFEEWARGKNCYMSNYMDFGEFPKSIYKETFMPVKEVNDMINDFCYGFSNHTIGLHIRRTDNAISIENSPTQLFIDKVKEEIAEHDETKVFLATDSNEVKAEFKGIFGNRIITPEAEASRGDLQGIRGGLAEMYALAATKKIYGSKGSTYSIMAADIGGIEMQTLEISNQV